LQIEEYRQEPHPIFVSGTSELTGIIFYICVAKYQQRENNFFS
jgi:hypothetical protein